MTPSANSPLSRPDSPYRGLESFRYVDQPIFFARQEETRRLLRHVTIYRGVLFYGDSGVGKSSLINAGFIPAIREEGFIPERLRVQPRRGEEIIVERLSLTAEGKAPYLPSNFAEEEASARVVLSVEALPKKLRDLPEDRYPLLIFDQFEEFVTLFEETPRGEARQEASEAQEAILKVLVELLRDQSLRVKLLFVFREDYLAKLAKLFVLCPNLTDQYLRLTPPRTEALYDIIRGPFEKFPGQFGTELSPELARKLAAAMEEPSEPSPLNLSEVQIACLRLWQSQNPDSLFEQRGVQGLLEDYLSDAHHQLPADLRDPAVALLCQMVTPSGTRNVISAEDLINRVRDEENIPQDRLEKALAALEKDTKLVQRERRHEGYFYEIVSEFLVPWIRRKRAERLAQMERRKANRLVVISLLIAAAVGIAAWWIIKTRTQAALQVVLKDKEVQSAEQARQQAEANQAAAEQARQQAEANQAAAEQAKDQALQQKTAAEQERNQARTERDKARTEAATLRQQKAAVEQARDKARTEAATLRQQNWDMLIDLEDAKSEIRRLRRQIQKTPPQERQDALP